MNTMRRVLVALACCALCACDRSPVDPGKPALPPPPPGLPPGADPGQTERSTTADALVAFARGSELWVAKGDGSEPRRLVRMTGDVAAPAWSPNRTWIAFSSDAAADRNLYRRNVFIVRADGSTLRQVTPLPRSGEDLENAPKGLVRGRAALLLPTGRLGMKDLDVAIYGRSQSAKTDAGGLFEVHAPLGTTWIKVSGTYQGVRYSGATMLQVVEGKATASRDILLSPGGADDEAHAPMWAPDGKSIYFILRTPGAGGALRASTLRRIALDGRGTEEVFAPPNTTVDTAAISGEYASLWVTAWQDQVRKEDGKVVRLRQSRPTRVNLESRREVAEPGESHVLPAPVPLACGPGGLTAFARVNVALKTEIVVRQKTVATLDGIVTAIDFSPDGRTLLCAVKGAVLALDVESGASRPFIAEATDPAWYGR